MIFFFFRGFGFLVPVVAFAISALTQWLFEAITKDRVYYIAHGWPKLVALWLSGAAIYGLARYLDAQPGRVVIDKEAGQEMVLKQSHFVFLIPMKYWAYFLFALGAVFLFVN